MKRLGPAGLVVIMHCASGVCQSATAPSKPKTDIVIQITVNKVELDEGQNVVVDALVQTQLAGQRGSTNGPLAIDRLHGTYQIDMADCLWHGHINEAPFGFLVVEGGDW